MNKIKSLHDDIYLMNLALEAAEDAYDMNEVPIGAVIVSESGEILSKSHNIKEKDNNPCGHAEIIAIKDACQKIESWRLIGCRIYVTLEPCPMCLSAIGHARLGQCIFGAYDLKGGALSLGYNLYKDKRLNHTFSIAGGLQHYRCSSLLSKFFREKRDQHKNYK